MYYSKIKPYCIENGLGVRVSLFVSGCRNHCKGCFQPETWDFSYGKEFMESDKNNILELLRPRYIKGISLLGGDPLEPENQETLLNLVKEIKDNYPEKDVWMYTGYVYEDDTSNDGRIYTEHTEELLSYVDVLVDGPYIEEMKNITLSFRGSENQRIIDMNRTRAYGKIILHDFD